MLISRIHILRIKSQNSLPYCVNCQPVKEICFLHFSWFSKHWSNLQEVPRINKKSETTERFSYSFSSVFFVLVFGHLRTSVIYKLHHPRLPYILCILSFLSISHKSRFAFCQSVVSLKFHLWTVPSRIRAVLWGLCWKMWLCFSIDMTCPITLCLSTGKGCGGAGILIVALLKVLHLPVLYSCCGTGFTMAQTNPVADGLSILTQWFAKVGFEQKINHRVVNGGRFGQDGCQCKGGGWDLLIGAERSPHGNYGIRAPSNEEANTHSHWELKRKTHHLTLSRHAINRNICF